MKPTGTFTRGLIILFYALLPAALIAQEGNSPIANVVQNTKISGLSYMNFAYDQEEETNSFALKRGYLTIKSKLGEGFDVRFTQDITVDTEGSDAGNIEMRLKYLYLSLEGEKLRLFPNSHFELGLVHRTWLDYEQKVNPYRVQGKMFLERNKVINTADFGISYMGIIGGKIDKEWLEKTGSSQKGKYGSYGVSVVNGGGYHALEKNQNKVFEGYASLRPLPASLPGLQGGYAFAFGKGNLELAPDFTMHLGQLTYESAHITVLAQYYTGTGGYQGTYSDSLGIASNTSGWSAFGEFRIPQTEWALFTRYDDFTVEDEAGDNRTRLIAGISYHLFKNNMILFNYDRYMHGDEVSNIYEIALQIAFK